MPPPGPASPMPDTRERAGSRPGGLVVRPFRGLRYDPAQVSDLAAVTSPPYDVIDPDSATHLEELDPHNVVRLILPRAGAGHDRYSAARTALAAWLEEGVLRRDPEPALYVYEQEGPGLHQRGLLAAVGLATGEDPAILPHEDVMPGPVADRLDLMRATSAHLEPILLVYDGGGPTAALVDEVCSGPPLVATETEDGLAQRLWAVTDPGWHAQVADDLAVRRALIADGHHRYEAYRQLQAEHRAAGESAGGWDLGLALLVDTRHHPLTVRAIHRVVSGVTLAEAVQRAGAAFRVHPVGPNLPAALAALEGGTGAHPFVVTDGSDFVLLDDPQARAMEQALPAAQHSASWRALDASVLHALLLDRLWAVDDSSGRISYVHDAAAAVRAAPRSAGVAVLMRAVPVDVVLDLASRGERMPRKSTSFGPKPRTGLVLRQLEQG